MSEQPPLLGFVQCSFCGKRVTDFKSIICGPSVAICSECVRLCTEILAEQRAPRDQGA